MSKHSANQFESYINSSSLASYLSDLDGINSVHLDHDIQLDKVRQYIDGGRVDMKLRDELVTTNLAFVIYIAKRLTSYGLPMDDLIQEGNIGLLESLEKYDFDKANGSHLTSFAYHHITKCMMKFIENNKKIVKLNKNNNRQKVFHNLAKFDQQFDTISDKAIYIAGELNVPYAEVMYVMEYMGESVVNVRGYGCSPSGGKEVSVFIGAEGVEGDIFDLIADENMDVAEMVEEELSHLSNSLFLTAALAELDQKTRYVIKSRFLTENKPTLTQVGIPLGVTCERVRQLEREGLSKLKKILLKNGMNDFTDLQMK